MKVSCYRKSTSVAQKITVVSPRGSASGQKSKKHMAFDDYLVSGKGNYPNLYNLVIKTVTDCTVFLNMILKS